MVAWTINLLRETEMKAPFGITWDHRRAIGRAIRSFVRSASAHELKIDPKRLKAWADNIETGSASHMEWLAVAYLPCLPYTQPSADEEPMGFAIFCAAMVLSNGIPNWANGELHRWSGKAAQEAIAELIP
jgi:hypothetical protein